MASFPENWIHLTEPEWLVGDGIFNGQFHRSILGYKYFQDTEHAARFKTLRSVVENVIGCVKQWKICSDTWRLLTKNIGNDQAGNNRVWRICAGLYNMFHSTLRNLDEIK